jgi:hypothetical protein
MPPKPERLLALEPARPEHARGEHLHALAELGRFIRYFFTGDLRREKDKR